MKNTDKDMPIIVRWLLVLTVVFATAACGGNRDTDEDGKRKSRVQTNQTSDENGEGIVIIGKRKNKNQLSVARFFGGGDDGYDTSSDLNVNQHLWRASVTTLSKLPLKTVDPYSGILETEWYTPAGGKNEQVRTSVFILGPQLRTENIRVSVFVRERDDTGVWSIRPGNPSTATKVENVILKAARRSRVAANEQSES